MSVLDLTLIEYSVGYDNSSCVAAEGLRENCKNLRGNFIQAMQDKTIPPHDNCNSVVAKSKTICRDEEPLRLRKEPNREDEEEVDEVA